MFPLVKILKQLTEKEFEPTFYLLIYILIQLSNQMKLKQ